MPRDRVREEAVIRDRISSSGFVVRIPSSDIDACISESLLVALLTIFTIFLAVTDIPLTGLTFSARDHSSRISPGVGIYFGPYNYHVSHLRDEGKTDDISQLGELNISGSCDGEALESLELWSYKQDTLSIAPRAIAAYLDVAAYPPCVLYRGVCPSPLLDLATVFTMFDGLIDSVHDKLFTSTAFADLPFQYATESYWIDRLHHFLLVTFSPATDVRFHKVYHWPSRGMPTSMFHPRHLCHQQKPTAVATSSESKPFFCHDRGRWTCSYLTNSSDEQLLPIWDQIAARFEDLQQRYTGMELDFTMFITTMDEQSTSSARGLPSVTLITNEVEITTLIRGRECSGDGACRTVFIDDYRYERGVVESDEETLALYVASLRGFAQFYVWLRVVLLVWGCYLARSREPKYRKRSVFVKLAAAWRTILKIPGHTVLYGSWLPIVANAMAHFYDSGLAQSLGEFEWSSLNGFFTFNVVDYVLAASIQMRNIWMLVLVWKVIFTLISRPAFGQTISSHLTRRGILTLRGGWIGVVAWFTTFGMMRALRFRDINVLQVLPLARHTTAPTLQGQRNLNDYGLQYDIKCSIVAAVFVFAAGSVFHLIVRHSTYQHTSVFFCRSFYVPFSAGTLWSWSALDMYWLVEFKSHRSGPRMSAIPRVPSAQARPKLWQGPSLASVAPVSSVPPPRASKCRVCNFRPSLIHWPSDQGCPHHEPVFDIHRRTKALWSIVRLMNITNMTDPIALFRLYVTGRRLYLYRVSSSSRPSYSILLPTVMERSDATKLMRPVSVRWPIRPPKAAKTSDPIFELLQIVDSRDIPWHVLVNCG